MKKRLLLRALHCFIFLAAARLARAQTLDQAVANLLKGDCAAMGGENVAFGADLNAICSQSFGSANGTADSGGAGASSQTLALSVENRRKARLEEESQEKDKQKWSLYVNGRVESLNRNRTTFADGFGSTVDAISVGADRRFGDHWIAGGALTYRDNHGDFDAGGDFDTSSYGVTGYASFLPTSELFFDFSTGFASKSHTVHRKANFVEFDPNSISNINIFDGIVDSDSDGEEISARASFGYDHASGSVTIGPRVSVDWTQTRIDGYSESGGGSGTVVGGNHGAAGLRLVYEDQEVDSLQSVVGFQGSVAGSTSFGVLVTQGNADYIHEFSNPQRSLNVHFAEDFRANPQTFQFQTDKPVRDFFDLGVSVLAVLPGGMQPFVSFEATLGNEQFDNYVATLGVRWER